MLHYSIHHYQESAPWVTFIHGAGGSSSIWYKQIRAFKEHFNVLLIDLRGHGRSKSFQAEDLKRYTFDVIGDDIIEVLDHLKIRQTHFAGISLGTVIIRELADRYPERVLSLVMGGAILRLNLRGQILMRIGTLLKSVIPYMILYRFFAFIIMPRKKHRNSRNLFVREAKKLYQKEFKRWFSLAAEVNPLLKMIRKNATTIPSFFIMGSEDYMFLPAVKRIVSIQPNTFLHIIPDCGHVVNVDEPDQFNSSAISFLRSLD